MANRSSARLAFAMRAVTVGVGVFTGLFWNRVFVRLLGPATYGLFMSFQKVATFAGFGDLGLAGSVGLRTAQMLGKGEKSRLEDFLASVKTLLLLLALAISFCFLVLSPWLPNWLGFRATTSSGALPSLFAVGALLVFLSYVSSYYYCVNLGCSTAMWPIVPGFVLAQIQLALQWLAAKQGQALWVLGLVSGLTACCQAWFGWFMLRVSFPQLARFWTLKVDFGLWREALQTSLWMSLFSLGSLIYATTDALLVNAGFGAAAVPAYGFNRKPIEIGLQVILSASAVSIGKLNTWLADLDSESQDRAKAAVQRLAVFQSLAGLLLALTYLAMDNLFIKLWVGPLFQEPLALQWAFALTLAITAAGDAAFETCALLGATGLRVTGLTLALTALLNLGLGFLSMRVGWLCGIAYATVLSQTLMSVTLAFFLCRRLGFSTRRWLVNSWLLPFLAVCLLGALELAVGSESARGIAWLALFGAAILAVYARLLGFNGNMVGEELAIARRIMSSARTILSNPK